MASQGNWFTIVASDLFAGSFAAILIIDAATPKKPISIGEPTLFEMRYEAPVLPGGALDCTKTSNVVFAFTDDQGEHVLTTGANLSGKRAGDVCQVVGLLEDVALNGVPDDGRILVTYRPPALNTIGVVLVTLSTFQLECTESALCTE